MPPRTLNVAFIGCGRVAQWQGTLFKQGFEGARVISVCDLDRNKAVSLAKSLGAEVADNDAQVFADPRIDLVSIMTESGHHYRHSRSALLAGKHVIVEKPPCMFAEQVIELKELAAASGLMYAPIFQNRFNPAIKILKQAHDAGRFGKVVCVAVRLFWCRYQDYYQDGWHGTWELDGGVINQQAIHHVDAMNWICGPVADVSSFHTRRLNELEAEDTVVCTVKFCSGAVGTLEATTAARPRDMDASLSIIGELGSASIGGIALNKVERWEFVDPMPEDSSIPERYSVDVPNGYGYSHGPLIQEIINKTRANDLHPPVSADSAASTVQLIHSIYRSAEDGAVVRVSNNLRSRNLGRRQRRPGRPKAGPAA